MPKMRKPKTAETTRRVRKTKAIKGKKHGTENMPRSKPIDKSDSINILLGHYPKGVIRPVSIESQVGKRK